MKLWFDFNSRCHDFDDSDVKLGIGWFRHHKNHKWKGFTATIYLPFHRLSVTFVNNKVEYDKKMEHSTWMKNQ